MSLSILTYNVSSISKTSERKSIFNHIKQHQIDIVFLQESHSSSDNKTLWSMEWGGKIIWLHDTSRGKGLTILLRRALRYRIIKIFNDPDCRYQFVELKIFGHCMTLCNVYGPNTDNPNFFSTLFKQLNDFTCSEIVMGGNFNIILNHTLDKENGPNHSNKLARDDLLSHMRLLNLKDVFREINPTEKQFTRFNCNPFKRLDSTFF